MVKTIIFESDTDRKEIYERGLKTTPSPEALLLGKKYIDKINSGFIPKVSVKHICPTIGDGLFAEEDIPLNTYCGEYTGTVRKNDRRYFEPLNNYCYEYPVPDDIGRNYVIDATNGNLTRYINHSFEPNLKPIHVYYDGFYHLIFLSIRLIKKGEQLSFNYGKSYWYVREKPLPL